MFLLMPDQLILLAVRHLALVARVRLFGVVDVLVRGQVAHLRELPAADIARVWCVAGVDATDVRAQISHLCERSTTHHARVRLFACVYAYVIHQVANVPEPFATQLAFTLVRRQVLGQEPLGREHASAFVALQVSGALHLLGHRLSPLPWLHWSLLPLNLMLWLILVTPYRL